MKLFPMIRPMLWLTSAQVTTLTEAENAAAAAVYIADGYVKSGQSTPAQRATIQRLANIIGADALALQQDRDAGKPLVFDAINTAIANFAAFQQAK